MSPFVNIPLFVRRTYTSSSKHVEGKVVSTLQKLTFSQRCILVSECYFERGLSETAYTKFIEANGEPNGSIDYALKALDALTEYLRIPGPAHHHTILGKACNS